MAEKNENRRHQRYMVEDIHGNVLYTSDIDVLNISVDGAAIETPKRLEVNREYMFKIKYKDTSLSIKGLVVWALLTSRAQKSSPSAVPVYRAGIKFTDVLTEKADTLLKFIEENSIKKTGDRLGGIRFTIGNAQNITIDVPHKYSVKKISFSGMLVETEYPLTLNAQYDIELFLNGDTIKTVGRVAYCDICNDTDTARYDIGIEFVTLSDHDREALKQFISTLESD